MIDAETALLQAVRDRLREIMQLDDRNCQIELDDLAPSIASEDYWAIVPATATPGRRNQSSGIWDMSFGVRVVLLQRTTNVPRDRRRDVFMKHLHGINAKLAKASAAIHFEYTNIINDANSIIANDTETATPGKFYEPLRWAGLDRPQTFVADAYAGQAASMGDPVVGIKRAMNFTGARFLREKS